MLNKIEEDRFRFDKGIDFDEQLLLIFDDNLEETSNEKLMKERSKIVLETIDYYLQAQPLENFRQLILMQIFSSKILLKARNCLVCLKSLLTRASL